MVNKRLSPRAEYGYIHGLDGIRAIAVMIVILAHTGLTTIIPGGFGVTVFFFISGFLITRLLLAEREKNGFVHLGNFYTRRFLRLLPALFAMVVVTAVFMIAMGDTPRQRDLLSGLGYFMNYNNIALGFQGDVQTSPWGHLWSLAVEEHFYLLFPLLLIGMGRDVERVIKWCLALCAIALFWRLFTYYGTDFPRDYNYFATETRMDSILYGCLLSLLLHVRSNGNWKQKLTGWHPTLSAGFILLCCFVLRDEGMRQTLRYSYQGFALFILILNLYYFRPLSFAFAVLELRVLKWIGQLSYGLYLWHIPAMYVCNHYFGLAEGSLSFALTAIALTIIVSAISYYGLEQYVVSLRKRFGAYIVKAPQKAPA